MDQAIDKWCIMGSNWVLVSMERVTVSKRELIAALQESEHTFGDGRDVAEDDTVTRSSGTVSAKIIQNIMPSGEVTEGTVVT